MSRRNTRTALIALVCGLALVLAVLLFFVSYLLDAQLQQPTIPPTTTQQTTASTTAATTAPTTVPPTTTQVTTEPTTAPTQPQPIEYILTFVGDCTFADINGNATATSFSGVIGTNYDYPFADVIDYFQNDDCTFVNLECSLTDRGTPKNKQYVYRGDSRYINILTQSSVEYANIVNNHASDHGAVGYEDTVTLLTEAGIAYAEEGKTTLFTTESGLTIGVYANLEPRTTDGVVSGIKKLRQQGAEIVIASFHWGKNYYYKVSDLQETLAHAAIDAGADIVYGHHPHVLQRIEEYNGGIILYSVGNFAYGGNRNPPDKDSAIFQQQILRDPDGTVRLGELTVIPCHISGILSYGNDYQPTPMEIGSKEYNRTLTKLDGTWDAEYLDRGSSSSTTTATTPKPTETVPATTPTTVPETTPTTVPETTPTTVPETSPSTVPETSPSTVPETSPSTVPETTPTTVPETSPSTVPETTPTTVPETTQAPVPETTQVSVPETTAQTQPSTETTDQTTASTTGETA